MDEVTRRVRAAARDASSNDDLVDDPIPMMWDEHDMPIPLDESTLDERAARVWDSRRRDADD